MRRPAYPMGPQRREAAAVAEVGTLALTGVELVWYDFAVEVRRRGHGMQQRMPNPISSLRRVFRSIHRHGVRGSISIANNLASIAKKDIGQKLRYQELRSEFDQHRTEQRLSYCWSSTNYNRTSLINLLLATNSASRYLEIGCADNTNFDAVIAEQKVGIDPGAGGTHRMTSDEFFAGYASEPFDLIFIDGLHTYEQVAKDIRNSLRFLHHGGWILLHDMLPRDWLEEHVPRLQDYYWTGDVWKVGFELAQTDGVEFKIFKIDFGVGVLRTLMRNVRVPDLANELGDKRFPYLYENVHRLPIVEYDEGRMWIRSQTRRLPEK